ncbi:MAG TPA: hybrid sensor histidine kinase/response regulator [Anaerolineae bacterium]|nr:hybrid sensor histidine kinase/response regulator [Anaerolineae bacterium]
MQPLKPPDSYRILIIDDNAIILKVMTAILKKTGYSTIAISSSTQGLEYAINEQPDLILLDVVMPEMDGFDVCRHLKNHPKTVYIPIIFMTALSQDQHKVKGFQLGAVDYLTKPVNQAEVLMRVATHLRLYDLNNRLRELVDERTSQLQATNAELEQSNHYLSQLDKAKSDFINIASHELLTPLTSINNNLQLLHEHLEPHNDQTALNFTDTAQDGANRLLNTINQFLDASQTQFNSIALITTPVSIADICQQIIADLQPKIDERHITIHIDDQLAQLPPIDGHTELLYKALWHVITNAIKYTPNEHAIFLEGHTNSQTITLIIRDTGIGIDPPYLDLIFEKWYQIQRGRFHSSGQTKYKGGGLGLGLDIARNIIIAHQGKIWAESQGHDETNFPGSRFIIQLPINQ